MANVITITALNSYVKALLEHDPVLTDVALRGEISNFTNHFKTGHFYFSLKDEKSSVKAVMFRGDATRLAFVPQNGMHVVVRCRISLFERDGAFQIYVEDMFPDGVGAMQLAFEQLKEKLLAEGLFDPAHKRPLPTAPRCVGLVTSKTGAAIQDILQVARRRNPAARFLLCPVTVQGNEAAPGIAKAITLLCTQKDVDVIVVARGGGSKEDLWVFNSEIIARAAYASTVPVVSAIGHEIDHCILDFVADLRAPTPSAAAELVMPDLAQQITQMHKTFGNIQKNMQTKLKLCYNETINRKQDTALQGTRMLPRTLAAQLTLKDRERMQAMGSKLARAQAQSVQQVRLCESLSPLAVLARGYAVVEKDGKAVRTISQATKGDAIKVRLYEGTLHCRVEQVQGQTKKKTED